MRDLKRARLLALVLPVAIVAVSTPPLPATPAELEHYLNLAEENSAALQSGALRLGASEKRLAALPRWYLPDSYGEVGYSTAANSEEQAHGALFRVVAEWTLWDGGRRSAAEDLLRREGIVSYQQQKLRRLELRKRIALTFFRASRLAELQQIESEKIAVYRRLSQSLQPRVNLGTAGESEILNAQLRARTTAAERESTLSTLAALQQSLELLSGGSTTPSSPPAILPLSSLALPEMSAAPPIESDPRYLLLSSRLAVARSRYEALSVDLNRPRLSAELYGGYGPHRDVIAAQRAEAGATVTMRFPLTSSQSRSERLGAARRDLDSERLELEQALSDLRIERLQRESEFRSDLAMLTQLEQMLPQARRSLQLAGAEFRRGVSSSADLLDAIDTYYGLRSERLERLLRLQLALFEQETLLLLINKTKE